MSCRSCGHFHEQHAIDLSRWRWHHSPPRNCFLDNPLHVSEVFQIDPPIRFRAIQRKLKRMFRSRPPIDFDVPIQRIDLVIKFLHFDLRRLWQLTQNSHQSHSIPSRPPEPILRDYVKGIPAKEPPGLTSVKISMSLPLLEPAAEMTGFDIEDRRSLGRQCINASAVLSLVEFDPKFRLAPVQVLIERMF